jgi:PAS domain S-box-containing protein
MLIQEGELGSLYDRIVEVAAALLRSDFGSMQVYDSERNALRLVASRGFHPESAAFWQWVDPGHRSTCGTALTAEQRIVVADVESSADLAGTRDLDEYRRSDIRAVQSTPLRSRSGDLIGMISNHWREPHLPNERQLRRLDVLARQAADLIERGRLEARLRESESKNRWLAAIVDSSEDAIISTDLDGRILSWNYGAERVFGFTADEALGNRITLLTAPEARDEQGTLLDSVRAGERFVRTETVRLCKDGRRIVAALTVSPVMDGQGKVVGVSQIIRDVTDRKRQEEQIAVLARETEHRTKNVLAAVQATINLSDANTIADLKRIITGRISALARVHALFIESHWAGADLFELTSQELAPFRDDIRGGVRVDGPKVSLRPSAAQCLAAVIHELATNAAKYGCLSVSHGQLEIGWSFADDGAIVLRWHELNGPRVGTPDGHGVGMSVMEKLITGALCGELRLDWRPQGLLCEIRFHP